MVESVTTEWTENTTTLGEIAETKSFPCVVKVCEQIGNKDEMSPFSSGDLIKIDSIDVIQKIRGRFVEWVHASGSYEEIIQDDVSIPVIYEGFVQVLPKHGVHYVYHNIRDLMSDFPRYVMTLDGIASHKIPKDEILETISLNRAYGGTGPSFAQFRNLEEKYIKIPLTTLGRFQVLRDDMEYTLQEVIQRFPLPQIVQFTDLISTEQMSMQMEDAIAYLEKFERKVMLEEAYSEHVMLGQYKSVHPDPVTAKFRRAAFLIPLSNSDLRQITVQYPVDRDSEELQEFMTENFQDTNTARQFVDDKSKFECCKKQSIRFFEMSPSRRPLPAIPQTDDPSQGVASSPNLSQRVASFSGPSQGAASIGRPLPAIPQTDADATKEVETGIKARLKGFLKKPAKSKERPTLPQEPKSESDDTNDEEEDDYENLDFKKITVTWDTEKTQTLEPIFYENVVIGNGSVADDLEQTTNSETNDDRTLKFSDTVEDDSEEDHLTSNC